MFYFKYFEAIYPIFPFGNFTLSQVYPFFLATFLSNLINSVFFDTFEILRLEVPGLFLTFTLLYLTLTFCPEFELFEEFDKKE